MPLCAICSPKVSKHTANIFCRFFSASYIPGHLAWRAPVLSVAAGLHIRILGKSRAHSEKPMLGMPPLRSITWMNQIWDLSCSSSSRLQGKQVTAIAQQHCFNNLTPLRASGSLPSSTQAEATRREALCSLCVHARGQLIHMSALANPNIPWTTMGSLRWRCTGSS